MVLLCDGVFEKCMEEHFIIKHYKKGKWAIYIRHKDIIEMCHK